MLKNSAQTVRILMAGAFIAISPCTIQSDWRTIVADNSTLLTIAATASVTYIMGKIARSIYKEYSWPNKRIIEHSRSTYATIYNDIHIFYNTYKNDSQSSEWDLKEYITHTEKSYPFRAYHEQIMRTLWILIKYNRTITHELNRIYQRRQQLIYRKSVESMLLTEELIQLENKGKSLQKYITKTYIMLSALKNKVASFKEYKDDYHCWTCT